MARLSAATRRYEASIERRPDVPQRPSLVERDHRGRSFSNPAVAQDPDGKRSSSAIAKDRSTVPDPMGRDRRRSSRARQTRWALGWLVGGGGNRESRRPAHPALERLSETADDCSAAVQSRPALPKAGLRRLFGPKD